MSVNKYMKPAVPQLKAADIQYSGAITHNKAVSELKKLIPSSMHQRMSEE